MIQILNTPVVLQDIYVQWPGERSPSEIYGGTWKSVFDKDGVFFRTPGGEALAFNAGVQKDQMQRIVGTIRTGSRKIDNVGDNTSGAFRTTSVGSKANAYVGGVNIYTYEDRKFDSGLSPDARVSATTSGETRPVNMTYRIWKRLAAGITDDNSN